MAQTNKPDQSAQSIAMNRIFPWIGGVILLFSLITFFSVSHTSSIQYINLAYQILLAVIIGLPTYGEKLTMSNLFRLKLVLTFILIFIIGVSVGLTF